MIDLYGVDQSPAVHVAGSEKLISMRLSRLGVRQVKPKPSSPLTQRQPKRGEYTIVTADSSENCSIPRFYDFQDELKVLKQQPKPHVKLEDLRGQWMRGNELDVRSAGTRTVDAKTDQIK
ncbi:unnamed protein product [Angiostrongylus costaricensis]|uniref:RNA-directed DNA polymerase n=1 Tax=Angiostrongylus costaricensis TaxID=334426 RepID=A0A0R3PAV9_ANGCS|nr:unnamed protein product [Angiostrongylus costaricensis]